MDDPITYHEMSLDSSDPDPYADTAIKEKIRKLEELEIRPAITVYRETDDK